MEHQASNQAGEIERVDSSGRNGYCSGGITGRQRPHEPKARSGALGAHPQNTRGMLVGVALFAPRVLLRFRCVAASLQHFVRA